MFYLLWYNIENKWKENMLVEHQIIFFFCLSIIVAIFTKKLIVDKLDAISSFDSYVFSKLQMSEWWELQNEDNCEFQLRFSPKNENCFFVSAYDYFAKTRYNYIVSRGKTKNIVRRLGVEKICFGKVGLP